MSRFMSFDATLTLKDDVEFKDVESELPKTDLRFEELSFNPLDRTVQIEGDAFVDSPCRYLKDIQYALNDLRKYVCNGEDAYVIDQDAVWPAGWRFVFEEDGVKCYEGMMIFVEEVKL